jgi:hypothetical protein
MSAGAGQDSVPTLAQAVERLDRVVELMERVLEATPKAVAGTVQQVTVPQQSPPPQRAERLVFAMCVATAVMGMVAGGTTVAAILQGQRISDMRTDMQTERLSREAMDNWTAQEVTAIRSYITNGKLQPMQPRPKRQPEPQP